MVTKIILTALCGVFCALIIKDKSPQIAFAVSITAALLILGETLPVIGKVHNKLKGYATLIESGGDVYGVICKVVIIALATRLTAEMCRDIGERAVGAKVELAGTAAGLLCAMPLVDKALALIGAL